MVAEDSDIFNGFVFDGQDYPPERLEQATRAVQRQLSSRELRHVNDALLSRLAEAKEAHAALPKKMLLDDPAIRTLVNTLALVNTAWITTVITKNIKSRPHPHGFSTDELYSTALTGSGEVGGVVNAILTYDYRTCGVAAFSEYLARAVTNALLPTPKQEKTYRRVVARTQSIHEHERNGTAQSWVDRTAPRPETTVINRELLEVVRNVIPRLPTPQQRDTGTWMIDRILATGELPMAREVAQMQQPPVSRERGRQIMEATVDSIRRQIEADYPQLAEQGVNGWDAFKQAFTRTNQAGSPARADSGRTEKEHEPPAK